MTEVLTENIEDLIIRTPYGGCFGPKQDDWWGCYLTRIKDPTATIDYDPPNKFELAEDFVKIPTEIFSRIYTLFYKYAKQQLEVAVRFYRTVDGKQWKCVVPHQVIGVASVDFDYSKGLIDIITGEDMTATNSMSGWQPAGTYHSHHTMSLEWSVTDDNDELGSPGLHGLIHSMNLKKHTYVPIASIVLNGVRHRVDADKVIDLDINLDLEPHVNCEAMIKLHSLRVNKGGVNYGYNAGRYLGVKNPGYDYGYLLDMDRPASFENTTRRFPLEIQSATVEPVGTKDSLFDDPEFIKEMLTAYEMYRKHGSEEVDAFKQARADTESWFEDWHLGLSSTLR